MLFRIAIPFFFLDDFQASTVLYLMQICEFRIDAGRFCRGWFCIYNDFTISLFHFHGRWLILEFAAGGVVSAGIKTPFKNRNVPFTLLQFKSNS